MTARRLLALAAALAAPVCGCAPAGFEKAESHFARRHQVTDASVRRLTVAWEYRVDEEALALLQEAEAEPDLIRKRATAAQALRRGQELAVASVAGEIRRLPLQAQLELARRAHCPAESDQLASAFQERAQVRLVQRLAWLESAHGAQIDGYLRRLARSAEPQPDDRGRLWRVALLSWGAVPAWAGIRNTQQRLDEQLPARLEQAFERCAVFRCAPGRASDFPGTDDACLGLLEQHAPAIVQELRPDHVDADRFGRVFLEGRAPAPTVRIDPAQPTVYGYSARARVHGSWHDQLVYVWWYPRRPAMTRDDPAAGEIDGATLRITLDSQGQPAIFEVLQACGCGHLVWVTQELEHQAEHEFGGPEPGRTHAVQRRAGQGPDLTVAGTVPGDHTEASSAVHVESGYHTVVRLDFNPPQAHVAEVVTQASYGLRSYSDLEQLPLGSGVASMFGADGLVHNAGRKEGWLLAPTGMLSAGQPRQRGTQKIHWDAYDFDDPDLLDRSLRLPTGF